jgi:hypothetical protein
VANQGRILAGTNLWEIVGIKSRAMSVAIGKLFSYQSTIVIPTRVSLPHPASVFGYRKNYEY